MFPVWKIPWWWLRRQSSFLKIHTKLSMDKTTHSLEFMSDTQGTAGGGQSLWLKQDCAASVPGEAGPGCLWGVTVLLSIPCELHLLKTRKREKWRQYFRGPKTHAWASVRSTERTPAPSPGGRACTWPGQQRDMVSAGTLGPWGRLTAPEMVNNAPVVLDATTCHELPRRG